MVQNYDFEINNYRGARGKIKLQEYKEHIRDKILELVKWIESAEDSVRYFKRKHDKGSVAMYQRNLKKHTKDLMMHQRLLKKIDDREYDLM
jgi:hypothetical protein